MPTEFLTGMQLGSTMAARAQDMRASALNMTQRLMQMDQQAQMFPLELQHLNNRNQVETLNIQAANEAMSAKHADDLAWAYWHTKHTKALDILIDPPTANTMDGAKRIAEAQNIIGQTAAAIEFKNQQMEKNPLIKAQIDRAKAAEAASKAAQALHEQQQQALLTGRSYSPTADIKNSQYADHLESQAAEVEADGDTEQAEKLRNLAATFRAKVQRSATGKPVETPDQRQRRLDRDQQLAQLNKQLADAKLVLRSSPTSKEAKRKVEAIESEKAAIMATVTPASESPRLQQPPALAKPAAVTSTRPGYQRDEQTNRQVINIQGKWHVLMKDSQGRLFNVPSSRVDEYSQNGYEVVL